MPQKNKIDPTGELGQDTEAQQGMVLQMGDLEHTKTAFELTRDYRGDTTIHLKTGEALNGFVFSVEGDALEDGLLHLVIGRMPHRGQ